MKKLMFAVAAIAACAAVADVTSANVVGYQKQGATNGFMLATLPFGGVATTKISLQDIIPHAPEGEDLEDDMFSLQTFDEGANMLNQWYYYVKDGESWGAPESAWYEPFDPSTKGDHMFGPGEGFMFESYYGQDSGAGYTIAGQVLAGETKVPVNSGFTLMGNIRPTPVDIQDIVPYAPEGEDLVDDMFSLQTFDSGANMTRQWYYYVKDGESWGGAGECLVRAV